MIQKSTISKQFLVSFSTITAILIGACTNQKASETTKPVMQVKPMTSLEMADAILGMWKGDYNNDLQISAFQEDGVPIWIRGNKENESGTTFGGFLPVTSYYRTVDMPAFGERVIYLEEFTFKEDPYRQRVYTVIHDAEKDVTRVKLWYFKDKETYRGAWKNLSVIENLSPDDFSPLPDNCDLYVSQSDDGRLYMKMPKDQCKFGSSIFDYQVSLDANSFWYRDRIVDADTMRVKVTAGSFGYHKLDKVNP